MKYATTTNNNAHAATCGVQCKQSEQHARPAEVGLARCVYLHAGASRQTRAATRSNSHTGARPPTHTHSHDDFENATGLSRDTKRQTSFRHHSVSLKLFARVQPAAVGRAPAGLLLSSAHCASMLRHCSVFIDMFSILLGPRQRFMCSH